MGYRTYHMYIMCSLSRTLYTGVTNDPFLACGSSGQALERRVLQHKEGKRGSFTARYNVNRLVYFEEFSDINQSDHPREGDQSTRRSAAQPVSRGRAQAGRSPERSRRVRSLRRACKN